MPKLRKILQMQQMRQIQKWFCGGIGGGGGRHKHGDWFMAAVVVASRQRLKPLPE